MSSKVKKKKNSSKNPETSLPAEVISELDHLSILLQAIKGNCLVFALYKTVADREFVVEKLKRRVSFPIEELFLSEIKRDVIGLLSALDGANKNQTMGLFLYDLERTFPESLGNLNLQREVLGDIPHAIVFWVREFALREIADKAPDFWAWRSEVFDFRLSQPELAKPLVQGMVAEPQFFHKTKADLERRISLFRELLTQQEQQAEPDKGMMAHLANQIGLMYHYLSEYKNALSYYEQSLKIYRELRDKRGEGATLNNISQIYHVRGDYDSALDYLQQSLKIFRQIGDKSDEGGTLNNIGEIYRARGDYYSALDYLEQSLKIYRQIGDKNGEGVTLNNIGEIYRARRDYNTALDYWQQSLKICHQIDDKRGEGRTLNNISQIYHARGDYDRALDYLQQSLKICRQIGDKSGEGVICFNMAKIYENQGDIKKAIGLVQKTVDIDRLISHPDLERDLAYLNKLKTKLER